MKSVKIHKKSAGKMQKYEKDLMKNVNILEKFALKMRKFIESPNGKCYSDIK